ncbi:MAG TPA: outer membrane beta-barrel protein [Chitinophagaceae bacterium]|nr:outer membrane beta-barrel protein [Chitinophagaceae bacterium]
MKKLTTFVLAALIYHSASSQIIIAVLFGDKLNTGKLEFGIVVSPSLTTISNIDCKLRNGFNLGIYFNIRPDKKFFIHAEGIAKGSYGAKGIIPYPTGSDTLDNLFAEGSVERKIKTFSLPILCRYAISPKFFAEAGIQADMMLGAKDIFNSEINGNDLDYTVKINDQVALLDFGLTGGLFYKFRKDKRSMGAGIRYFQGLTDILTTTNGTQTNAAWQLIVTIPIGAGKAPQNGTKK